MSIVVGSPIANRQEAELEALIGFFVNSLVMRVRVWPEASFSELLAAVRSLTLEAYQHQDIPFERLVEELSPERSLNSTQVFQVVFALQNAPMEAPQLKGLKVEPVLSDELRVHFDLEVHGFEQEGELRLYWVYNRDLFEGWRIEQMARHYERLLATVVAVPDERLYRLDMLSAEERQTLLEGFNATASAVPERTLTGLFEEQVERTPEAVALLYSEQRLSYAELNERANRVAHHLIGLGVGPETLVRVALERCMEMVMALLGILKAGGAYLPLDPDYPEARLAYMLADAAPLLVISSATLRRRLPETIAVIKESSGPPHSPRGSRSHLLEANGFVVAGRLHLDWTYSRQVHRWATVERLARGFSRPWRPSLGIAGHPRRAALHLLTSQGQH